MTQALIPKDLFIGLDDVVHLCTGGEAPMLKASRDALLRFAELKSDGMRGRSQIVDRYVETKAALAEFLDTPGGPDDLAFLGHAADGFNVLANGIDWRRGDNVISVRREYPSSLLPWLARSGSGVSLVAVDSGDGVEDRIAEAMTPRTRLVCASYVSYLTGYRLDLPRLGAIARANGTLLAVDASHALGAMPIPVGDCDVIVSCCYKFALGVHGVGVFYVNPRLLANLFQPAVGWFSVEWPGLEERSERYTLKHGSGRFELGNPSFVSLFVLREGLRVLAQVGSAAIEAHVLELGERLRVGLVDLGLDVWTPAAASRRATNIVFGAADADGIVERLRARRVLAWSGDGRVRFSIHGFTDTADVDAAIAAVAAVA